MIRVAALYCDPQGPYPNMPDVETWALPYRDARKYMGRYPVVAHPPCGPWSRLSHLSRRDPADAAVHAVWQVHCYGGILEHPHGSRLFDYCQLPKPGAPEDQFGGYTIEVCQCDWGHVARKRTWLYLCRVRRELIKLPVSREPTHWASGGRTPSTRKGSPVPPGIKVCSAQQRRRTPPEFARWLVDLAANARNIIENEKGESGDG
jgi:hypothetical protein